MDVAEAQREVRLTFRGGFAGQLVSGLLWLASAGLATWASPRYAIVFLVVGGFFIFPLTQLVLRGLGGPSSLEPNNPLNALGMQAAFVLPLTLPLVGAAALYRLNWFYPAFMIALGAHYLPFVFLYGMRMFWALAAILVSGGLVFGLYVQSSFELGAWFTGIVLLAFSAVGLRSVEPWRPVDEEAGE